MAVDIQQIAREVLTNALQSGGDLLQGGGDSNGASKKSKSNGGLSGVKGLAAGAGAAALAPIAYKSAEKLARSLGVDNLEDAVKSPGDALEGATSKLGDRVTSTATDKAKGALDDAGGPGGMMKEAAKGMLPFGGGGGGSKGGAPGVGKGRRMPIQQSVDIGIPIESVYNQFTQFEDWPEFMHRVKRLTQEEDCKVSFACKIWGKTKEFTADIETQRPNKRIKWRVSQGMTHTGVVTFHELGPELTRVMLGFDVDPGSLIEKFARGSRHIKRAARADLHRFKAFIEMAEQETGAWRGVIEEGELVEEHDHSYDEQRQYSDVEEVTSSEDSDQEDSDGEDKGEETQDRESDDQQDDDQDGDDQESPKAKRPQRQQRSRGADQQKQEKASGGRSQSGGRRRQSDSSTGTRARKRSSSGQSGNGGSGSSRSTSRSRSSRTSSNGQSAGRSRSRSQSRKS